MTVTDEAVSIDIDRLTEPAGRVESYIRQFVRSRPMPRNLQEAVEYALLGGGKRVRPILVIRACEAVGGDPERAMPAAGAIELIHNFSLVHDDLPAMDDDDLRRGQPTLHKHAGEAMAILAGDMMMGLAFELLVTRTRPAVLAARITNELIEATNNMINGQVYDTLPDFDNCMTDIQKLQTIHHNKTGALIRCSGRRGALAGDADDSQLHAIMTYAESLGLMFQVVDDLLDVTQSTDHLGKAAGKDVDAGKLTYPGVLGIDASRREVARLRDVALSAIEPLGGPADPLRQICEFFAVRTR
ncbi:MAG: polyprenyl synthetase family protein [Phycisphaeraceae bacterium]|nr:polyprenyl synthetase family protein [Phycisphaeraceae bacterium]